MLLLVGIRPSTDRQEDLEVPVLLLQQVQLLQVAVKIVALIVPRVAVIVNVDVGPLVREDDFSVWTVVAKCVENMGEFVYGDGLREVFTAIDTLLYKCQFSYYFLFIWSRH